MKKVDVYEKVAGISSSWTDIDDSHAMGLHFTNYLLKNIQSVNGCVTLSEDMLNNIVTTAFREGYSLGGRRMASIALGEGKRECSIGSGQLEDMLNDSTDFSKTIEDLYMKKHESVPEVNIKEIFENMVKNTTTIGK